MVAAVPVGATAIAETPYMTCPAGQPYAELLPAGGRVRSFLCLWKDRYTDGNELLGRKFSEKGGLILNSTPPEHPVFRGQYVREIEIRGVGPVIAMPSGMPGFQYARITTTYGKPESTPGMGA